MKAYIAGPMRGFPRYNFDAFYDAECRLIGLGFEVINPARLDANSGFNPDCDAVSKEMVERFVRRDVDLIIRCDVVVCLSGWQSSIGATAERHIALWLNKELLDYDKIL